jgi:hypothetical protein
MRRWCLRVCSTWICVGGLTLSTHEGAASSHVGEDVVAGGGGASPYKVSHISNPTLSNRLSLADFQPQVSAPREGMADDFMRGAPRRYEFTTVPIFELSEAEFSGAEEVDEKDCSGTGFIILDERNCCREGEGSERYFPIQYHYKGEAASWPHPYLVSNAHVLNKVQEKHAYSFRFHCMATAGTTIRGADDFVITTVSVPLTKLSVKHSHRVGDYKGKGVFMDVAFIDLNPIFTELVRWGASQTKKYIPMFDGFDLDADIHPSALRGASYGTPVEIYGYPDGNRDLIRNLPIRIAGSCATNPDLFPYTHSKLDEDYQTEKGYEIQDFLTNTFSFGGSSGSPIVAEVDDFGGVSKKLLGILTGSIMADHGKDIRVGLSMAIRASRLVNFIREVSKQREADVIDPETSSSSSDEDKEDGDSDTHGSEHEEVAADGGGEPPAPVLIRLSRASLTDELQDEIIERLRTGPAMLDMTEVTECTDVIMATFLHKVKAAGVLGNILVLKLPGAYSRVTGIDMFNELLASDSFEFLDIFSSRMDKLAAHAAIAEEHKEKLISTPRGWDYDSIQAAVAGQGGHFSSDAHRRYYATFGD